MQTLTLPIGQIRLNDDNPRLIKDGRFAQLVKSLQEFPEMLALRPLVVDEAYTVLGGNMRLRAMLHLHYTEALVTVAEGLSEAQKREFVIKDNGSFGEHDWSALANGWHDANTLNNWGLNVPSEWVVAPQETDAPLDEEEQEESLAARKEWVPDCLFPSNNEWDIPTLLPVLQATQLDMPFKAYGAEGRAKTKEVGCYHFYVDDYRFNAIWNDPAPLLASGCTMVVEPNCSLFNETPLAFGLHLIYKKRWLARYLQELGIEVLVDLNVSAKFQELNLLGVPKGWASYATRGYADRLTELEQEIALARRHADTNELFMVIYGGGAKVKQAAARHNLLYVEQLMSVE